MAPKSIADMAAVAEKDLRHTIGKCDGDEKEVLETFIDLIGSVVDGWQMRLDELYADDDFDE